MSIESETDVNIGLHIAYKIKQVTYAIEHTKSFLNLGRIIMSKVNRLKEILIGFVKTQKVYILYILLSNNKILWDVMGYKNVYVIKNYISIFDYQFFLLRNCWFNNSLLLMSNIVIYDFYNNSFNLHLN